MDWYHTLIFALILLVLLILGLYILIKSATKSAMRELLDELSESDDHPLIQDAMSVRLKKLEEQQKSQDEK